MCFELVDDDGHPCIVEGRRGIIAGLASHDGLPRDPLCDLTLPDPVGSREHQGCCARDRPGGSLKRDGLTHAREGSWSVLRRLSDLSRLNEDKRSPEPQKLAAAKRHSLEALRREEGAVATAQVSSAKRPTRLHLEAQVLSGQPLVGHQRGVSKRLAAASEDHRLTCPKRALGPRHRPRSEGQGPCVRRPASTHDPRSRLCALTAQPVENTSSGEPARGRQTSLAKRSDQPSE